MKKKIAVIMGGYSSEYQISIKSGEVAYKYISKEIYDVYKILILEEKWVLVTEQGDEFPINKHDFSAEINNEKIVFDCVFNAIHGHPGEDGTILAYFELLKIPHTSAPFYQMALTFNKKDCLNAVKQAGVKVAKSKIIQKGDTIHPQEIVEKLGLPCFVKPNEAGSSFGISKVKTKEQLTSAIQKALDESDEVLIEAFLEGTEVTVGVIEYKGNPMVLPITEIVTENDFFDYEAKYLGKSEEITPARISEQMEEKIKKTAFVVYKTLNMKGFSRSEYIIVNNEPHFLEMNTVPGLTTESVLPKQAKQAGIDLKDLFHNAIEMALKN